MKKEILALLALIVLFITFNVFLNCDFSKQPLKDGPFTMETAVDIAYKHRTSLEALRFSTIASEKTQKEKLSGYLPQVKASQKLSDARGAGKEVFDISSSQLIYSFAGPLASYKIAKKDTIIANLAELEHKDLIRFSVEVAFLKSWLLQRKKTKLFLLERSELQVFKKKQQKTKIGLFGKNEWLAAIANYDENVLDSRVYSEDLTIAQKKLERFIGKKLQESPTDTLVLLWKPPLEVELKPLQYFIQVALKNRKELKIKQREIERERLQRTFHKYENLPELSLFGNFGRSKYHGTGSSSSRQVGLQVSWMPFDGLSSYRKQQAAHARAIKASMEKQDKASDIKLEVQTIYYELRKLFKELVARNSKLCSAKNEFLFKRQEYNIGKISLVDFEEARLNWETVRFSWLELRVNAAIKQQELYFKCGYPKELV